jgi:hypothetical protein
MKNKYIEIATFLLMAATVTAGFLTTTDSNLLPPDWRPYLPFAIAGIILLKQLAYGVLDYLDDGIMNKSYKTPTTFLKALALLLLPLTLVCCTSAGEQSTDAELIRAQQSLNNQELIYETALIVYGPRIASPKWTPEERAAAALAIAKSRERLTAERLRLADIQARRAASVAVLPLREGTPPATLLLPAVTSGK